MPNKLFGIADPYYDALRVQSNQAIWPDAGGSTSGTGGILDNKIYLWPSDGSTIGTFDATETGLNDALAAAVSGDTVWLPSIPIALTAAITVPAGVRVIPISNGSILSFSGFSGAAVTLSANSVVEFLTVRFVATGTDAIGIDASVDDCFVYEPDVEVSGASATNHAINGGHEPIANEVWAMFHRTGNGHSITWTNTFTFDTATNDTTWYAIESWPTGFDGTAAGQMVMDYQANALYIARSTANKIWSLTNLAAIRAAPATSPTWAIVADNTTSVNGSTISTVQYLNLRNGVLSCLVRVVGGGFFYGEYVSGTWTWVDQGYDATGGQYLTYRASTRAFGAAVDTMRVYNPQTLAVYFDKACGFGAGNTQPIWRNSDPAGTAFFTTWRATAATTKIVNQAGTTVHDTGLTAQDGNSVTGAQLGSNVYVSMGSGELFLSDDGTTFSNPSSPGAGIVLDNLELGGGVLVWLGGGASAAQIVKNSLNRGVALNNKTGNIYSVMADSSGGTTLCGAQLIFPT